LRRDLPIAQHGGAITYRHDFGQPVGDVNHRNALRFQAREHAEQRIDLGVGKRCGGFVQDQHTRFEHQRAGDHHQMALGGTERCDQRPGIQINPEIIENRPRHRFEAAAMDQHAAPRIHMPGEDIFGNRKLFEHFDFLRHITHPAGARFGG